MTFIMLDYFYFKLLLQKNEIHKRRSLTRKPWELALNLKPPYNFAIEKTLRRHVEYRTANAMELWRDINSPLGIK